MAKLKLGFITGYNERVEPLVRGEVEVEGVELIPTHSDPSETFWRQLNFQEFEITEMSLSSYLIATSHGVDMIGIPVFPSRRFMHMEISYHVDSGVEAPGDLVGKRLGVGEYQQTSALWLRGVLEHDFGVSQFKVDWWMERTEELSHGGATGFEPPQGISFHRISPDKSLASMLLNHELDAAPIGRALRPDTNLIDRSTRIRGSGDWSKIKPMFPDPIAEGARFVKAHGFIPANHFFAIRGDIYRQYPWLAFNLYKGFLAAKEVAQKRMADQIPSGFIYGREYLKQSQAIFGDDPFPYGVEANRAMLQTTIDYSYEQGLTKQKVKVEGLVAPSTLEL